MSVAISATYAHSGVPMSSYASPSVQRSGIGSPYLESRMTRLERIGRGRRFRPDCALRLDAHPAVLAEAMPRVKSMVTTKNGTSEP